MTVKTVGQNKNKTKSNGVYDCKPNFKKFSLQKDRSSHFRFFSKVLVLILWLVQDIETLNQTRIDPKNLTTFDYKKKKKKSRNL